MIESKTKTEKRLKCPQCGKTAFVPLNWPFCNGPRCHEYPNMTLADLENAQAKKQMKATIAAYAAIVALVAGVIVLIGCTYLYFLR